MNAIEVLKADHAKVQELFRRYEQAGARRGEASRVHHGARLLDELPACRSHVLEVLR